jgi:hypothetical protein
MNMGERKEQGSTKKRKNFLDLINTFNKVAGYEIIIQKSVAFYIPIMNRLRKIKKIILFIIG